MNTPIYSAKMFITPYMSGVGTASVPLGFRRCCDARNLPTGPPGSDDDFLFVAGRLGAYGDDVLDVRRAERVEAQAVLVLIYYFTQSGF